MPARGGQVGVIVESILGLAAVPAGESPLDGLFAGGANCLAGVAVVNGRQSLIVDMPKLLDLAAIVGAEAGQC